MPDGEDPGYYSGLLERDRFAGNVLRGGLPVVPSREALPTASVELAYSLLAVRGEPAVLYVCLRDEEGAWGWETAATG